MRQEGEQLREMLKIFKTACKEGNEKRRRGLKINVKREGNTEKCEINDKKLQYQERR